MSLIPLNILNSTSFHIVTRPKLFWECVWSMETGPECKEKYSDIYNAITGNCSYLKWDYENIHFAHLVMCEVIESKVEVNSVFQSLIYLGASGIFKPCQSVGLLILMGLWDTTYVHSTKAWAIFITLNPVKENKKFK